MISSSTPPIHVDKDRGELRLWYSEQIYYLYGTPHIIRNIKLAILIWVGYVQIMDSNLTTENIVGNIWNLSTLMEGTREIVMLITRLLNTLCTFTNSSLDMCRSSSLMTNYDPHRGVVSQYCIILNIYLLTWDS